jgi:stage II sporulation protein D
MRRRLLLTAAAMLLLAPASADASVRHIVRGAGYGHGIGLSQYGALGFARQGTGYRAILAHYYRGTQLGLADTRVIRVLLQSGARAPSFSGADRAGAKELDPAKTYRVTPAGPAELELRDARRKLVGRFAAPLPVRSETGVVRLLGRSLNGVSDGQYRGTLELRPGSFGGVTAVNAVGLDDYLQGVVPGEMPASWPEEALRAQAVAARSYALVTDRGGEVFDQFPDTRSQVYRGLTAEQPTTNRAVKATAGEVLRYGGAIAVTYFFSTSGGRTENVENIFTGSGPRPYLVSVDDPFDGASPKHRWRFSFTQRQMQARLRGIVKGRFRRIKVVRRGESPRVLEADVMGTGGSARVRGTTLRTRLGLWDTWAYFARIDTRRASAAAGMSWLATVVGPRELEVVVSPPARGSLTLQRRASTGAWRAAGRLAPRADGRHRFGVRRAGTYRVLSDGAAGPPVTVR